jgi:aminodeoxychorismate lyase
MMVCVNGRFVPEKRAVISVFDRGFLYGDGLFESILVTRGQLFCWREHMERLEAGADFLKLTVPMGREELQRAAERLIRFNHHAEGILRVNVSRGVAGRGYSPKQAIRPALVMSVHPPAKRARARWNVITSTIRVPANDPLTRYKTANKLPHILARAQADEAGVDEAILLNTDGFVAEGTASNLFWSKGRMVYTPGLAAGALPGVTRGLIRQILVKMNIPCVEKNGSPAELRRCDGAFFTNTAMGVVEMAMLDGKKMPRCIFAKELRRNYTALLPGR